MNQYIIGHRGAAGLAPENTLKAFRVGCENGADVVECDVHLSKDKEIVVIHDNILNRTTNGKGWVRDYTVTKLKSLDAGQGEKIPLLSEVVDLVLSYKKKLIVEIKGESWAIARETTAKVAEFINQRKLQRYLIVHSFWHPAVEMMKELSPNTLTVVILMLGLPEEEIIRLIKNANADGASIAQDYISEKLVELAKKNAFFLDAWTLDYPETFNRMKEMGVNGLITNYPDRFRL